MNNQKNDKDFVLSEVLRLLSERYCDGMYEYLYRYQYPVYERMRKIEDTITENFDNMRVEDLKNILGDYWKLHIESAKKFKSEGLNFDIGEVKKKIGNELHVT